MKKMQIFLPILAMVFVIRIFAFADKAPVQKPDTIEINSLAKSPPDREKSLKAFSTILTVLKSPRCINCHPTADVPHQGDVQRLHPFGVIRGLANNGGLVQKCGTCHHTENNDFANVPGAPHWGLAPKTMGWFGLSDVEIAKRLLDKKQNGGRSPQDLVKHMSNDSLVLWAWNPGKGRSKPPVELDVWRNVLKEWLDNGAAIPTQ
jgi:hypothetical protein